MSDTLFNALVINRLPKSYEHFVVQESFNATSTFTKLKTRLQNYEDSRTQRTQTEGDRSMAMHSVNKRQGNTKISHTPKPAMFVGNTGHFARQCNKQSTTVCSKCHKRGHLAKACREKLKKEDEIAVSSYSECFISPLKEENINKNMESYMIADTDCSDIVEKKNLFRNLHTGNEKRERDPKGNLTPRKGIGDVTNNGSAKQYKNGRTDSQKCFLRTQ